jgi:hypothetical protein
MYEIKIYKISIPHKWEGEWLTILMKSQYKKKISPI